MKIPLKLLTVFSLWHKFMFMVKNNYIEKAIEICGGLTTTARLLNLAPPTVHQWITGRRPVPIERCVAIERATGGVVTRRDLRPDDWWKIWPELVDDDSAVQMRRRTCVDAGQSGLIKGKKKEGKGTGDGRDE